MLPGAVDTPIYEQAATYAGRRGWAPPPVVAPERVARACVAAAVGDRRPRRQVHVGPVNLPAVAGFRLAPAVYDALAPTLVRRVVLRGSRVADSDGNVLAPRPGRESERGGWTWWGRRGRG